MSSRIDLLYTPHKVFSGRGGAMRIFCRRKALKKISSELEKVGHSDTKPLPSLSRDPLAPLLLRKWVNILIQTLERLWDESTRRESLLSKP